MAGFNDTLGALTDLLCAHGYDLRPTAVPGTADKTVRAVFDRPLFLNPIVAIPDVHLSDARAGDIFASDGEAVARLVAVLTAVRDLLNAHPASIRALQLGDWFDVWRAAGGEVQNAFYGGIQNAAVYRQILDLDPQIGLAHLIGNHDASFLHALPD